jgi:hypothetical protein
MIGTVGRGSPPIGHLRVKERQMRTTALAWFVTGLLVVGLGLGTVMAGATQEKGQHSMSGTVSAIDHTTGQLTLKTGAGELKLHFPPASIQDLKEGQTITVHLAYSEGSTTR